MACRPSEAGRVQNLARPVRVICGLLGLAAVVGSFWLSSSAARTELAGLGALVLFVAVLLPALTEFSIDFLGFHATANPLTRERRMETVCRHEARKISAVARLVGVDPEQVSALVEEAVEDTCRLWRGPVIDGPVRGFVMCRAMHLVRVSYRLGGPYRVTNPDGGSAERGPGWATFAALDPVQRIAVALVDYAELDPVQVALMLDLDRPAPDPRARAGAQAPPDPGGRR